MKLAVLSHSLPPSPSGQAMVLYRLLKDWNPEDYCLLSRTNQNCTDDSNTTPADGASRHLSRLPGRYHYQTPELQPGRSAPKESAPEGTPKESTTIGRVIDSFVQFYRRIKLVDRVVKQEKCNALLACSGDLVNLPAGYLVALRHRIPFYAYIFDDYVYQWDHWLPRRFARLVELIIIKRAAGIIVPNEFLAEEYRRRYDVECTVIHNPHEDSGITAAIQQWPAHRDEIRIVYTGSIYSAHYGAFRNLMAALRQLDRPEVRLHVYTAQSREDLQREHIEGPVQHHSHIAPSEAREVQRQADVLFLPLAFDSGIPETIKTSAPGKLGEYLASGRPILVHAPADSFVSWYFRDRKCGVVVDISDPLILRQGIERMLDDSELRQKMTKSARICAQRDFSLKGAQTQFLRLLNYQERL
jgi:glycosyltransferase involved in cell wall biosynthesis